MFQQTSFFHLPTINLGFTHNFRARFNGFYFITLFKNVMRKGLFIKICINIILFTTF